MDLELGIAIGILLLVTSWTLFHLPSPGDLEDGSGGEDKLREFLILDVRGINQYCAVFVALIGVLGAIVAGSAQTFGPILNKDHLWPFAVALLAAAFSMLFFPAGYGKRYFNNLRVVWLRSAVCGQITVISTCYGLWNALSVLIV